MIALPAYADINSDLLEAAKEGDTAKVQVLLDKGADVNAKDNFSSWTALMFAARYGHTTIVQALLDKDADVNAEDDRGWTALRFAAAAGHTKIVKLLKQAGAKE